MKHFRKTAMVAAAFSLMLSVAFAADTVTQPSDSVTPAAVSIPATSGVVNQPDEATGTEAKIISQEIPAVAATPVVATPAQLGVAEMPEVLPGSFLYPFKQFAEWLELAFTFDPIEKANKQISLVSERLLEAKLLADLDDTDSEDLQAALDEYQDEKEALAENLAEIDAEEEADVAAGADAVETDDSEDIDLSDLETKLAETELARQSVFEDLILDEKWSDELDATLEAMQAESFAQTQDSLVELGGSEAAGEAFLNGFKAFDTDWQAANADFLTDVADFNASVAAEVTALQKEILAETNAMTQEILNEVNAEVDATIKEANQMTDDILKEVNTEVGNTLEDTNKMVNDIQAEIDADLKNTLNETDQIVESAVKEAKSIRVNATPASTTGN